MKQSARENCGLIFAALEFSLADQALSTLISVEPTDIYTINSIKFKQTMMKEIQFHYIHPISDFFSFLPFISV